MGTGGYIDESVKSGAEGKIGRKGLEMWATLKNNGHPKIKLQWMYL